MAQTAIEQLVEEIAFVGLQTRMVSARYEGVFPALRHTLDTEISKAANIGDGAIVAMNIADSAAEAIMTHFPNQPARDCRAGCDACCHLYVMVPPGVAQAISSYLVDNLTSENLEALLKKLKQSADTAAASKDPAKLRHRCPLLGEDGLCTIYEVRPPTCRAFTSGSVAACRSLVFDPNSAVHSIPQNPSQFRVYVEATAALQRAAISRGLPAQQAGLAAALLSVLPKNHLNK